MPVTPAIAKTSTPDASGGNPIAVFTVDAGAGPADVQAVVPVDASTGLPPVGGLPVAVQNFPATQTVAGTVAVSNFPATQPVSAASLPLPSNAAQETGGHLAAIDTNAGAQADAAVTTDVNGSLAAKLRGLVKILGDVWDSANHRLNVFIQNATLAVTQSGSWTVTAVQGSNWLIKDTNANEIDTVVKGTQAARGLGVQDLKDSGRTYIVITLDAVTGITAEALATMTINKGGTTSTSTNYQVTAGKTLRIQAMTHNAKMTSTTEINSRARIRSAAAVLATSPIVAATEVGTQETGTLVANSTGGPSNLNIPDGLEIAAGQQIGISHIESATTSTISVCVIAYEY